MHIHTCLSDFNIFTQVSPSYLDPCGHIISRLADMMIYRVSYNVFVYRSGFSLKSGRAV